MKCCDWSSDVCSSDLDKGLQDARQEENFEQVHHQTSWR
jgi:hypothetical protein